MTEPVDVGSGGDTPHLGSGGDTPHLGSGGDTPHLGSGGDTPHLGSGGDTPHPGSGRPSRLRRLAPILLALGVAGASSQLLPHLPHERQVELRLDDAASVTSVELAWARGGGDAMQGATWRFAPGQAPRSLMTTVRLPNGIYDLDIALERRLSDDTAASPDGGDAASVRLRRTITLDDAERISLLVR